MRKLTCILAFFLGIISTCLYYRISVISSASAENPGKQELLYSIATNLADVCHGYPVAWNGVSYGTSCKDYYQYYLELGGTNELIYYARTQLPEHKRTQSPK